jgi:peptidoglycan/LPS O-acetylase OafA/YrhL
LGLREGVGGDGVAIFFVLSGFLITSHLVAEHTRFGSISLSRFYIRRFFRLMPIAWLYLAIVAAIGQLGLPEAVACLGFYRQAFRPPPFSLTGHFWSLSCEEDFYMLWPGVLVALGLRRAPWVAAAAPVMLGLGVLHSGEWGYISSFIRTPIMLGCALAFVPRRRIPMHATLVGAALVSLVGLMFCRHTPVLGEMKYLVVAFLLWSTVQGVCSPVCRVLCSRPLTSLGVVSYSLYIWHNLTFRLPLKLMIATPVKFAIAVVASYLSYRLIESPMIAVGRRCASYT